MDGQESFVISTPIPDTDASDVAGIPPPHAVNEKASNNNHKPERLIFIIQSTPLTEEYMHFQLNKQVTVVLPSPVYYYPLPYG